MRHDVAQSWSHLQELLFDDAWNEEIGRFRSPLAFRGQCDACDPLCTGLIRLNGNAADLERHLLRNFMKYAHRDLVETDSFWHWLSLAQHHGMPTRLLDWSYSPLVAMHFATADVDAFDIDGSIWCVDYEGTHALLPEPLRTALRREGANSFTAQLLSETVSSLSELEGLAEEPFLLFFEPPSIDERIVNQYALFSIFSAVQVDFEDWSRRHAALCRQVIIPASLKWEVRDKLDQCNITERVLFPGLDGLTTWLRRHYRSSGLGRSAVGRRRPADLQGNG